MAWAVHVGVVAVFCFVFDVCCRNRDSTFSFFWGCVDFTVFTLFSKALHGQHFGDRRCQCSLAMIHVTNCPNIAVGFGSFKFLSRH